MAAWRGKSATESSEEKTDIQNWQSKQSGEGDELAETAGYRDRQNRIPVGVQIVTAIVFFAAGAARPVDGDQTVMLFDQIGVGHWSRFTTGALELIGAVLNRPGFTGGSNS